MNDLKMLNEVSVNYCANNDSLSFSTSDAADTSLKNYSLGLSTLDMNGSYGWWHDWYCPRYYPDYPTYITHTITEDKFKKAFNIAKMLLKERLLVSHRLPDFVKLVEKIADQI